MNQGQKSSSRAPHRVSGLLLHPNCCRPLFHEGNSRINEGSNILDRGKHLHQRLVTELMDDKHHHHRSRGKLSVVTLQYLLKRLGCHHIRKIAYRPQHNGLVEIWHRRLKDALRASDDDFTWVTRLRIIMLSLRCALQDDGQPAPPELVYGTPLTLPAFALVPSTEHIIHNVTDYSHLLKC